MILQRINTRGGGVLLKFPCAEEPVPGQCVAFDGKYFVIAHHFNGIASVFTKPGSAIDLPPGTHVDLKPVGRGFDLSDGSTSVIITGGTGFAAGLMLARHFDAIKRNYRMVAYTRYPAQVTDTMWLLSMSSWCHVKMWNTAQEGRPLTPFDPVDVQLAADTPVFFAGPKSLHEACRSELDKRGLADVKIRVNY